MFSNLQREVKIFAQWLEDSERTLQFSSLSAACLRKKLFFMLNIKQKNTSQFLTHCCYLLT